MRFIFFTDIHIDDEISVTGFEQCIASMLELKPELMINGGDLGVTHECVTTYEQMIADVPVPVHLVNGNHEMCNESLPHDKAGTFSRSWDHMGVHFVIFDVVRYFEPTEDHPWNWYGIADEPNLQWLADDLRGLSSDTPIILATHIPLSTSFTHRYGHVVGRELPTNEIWDAAKVLALLDPFKNVATLHGHDHENCRHSIGNIQILTTGAVAGTWWRSGLDSANQCGAPQGYRVMEVDDGTGTISSRYKAFQPHQDTEVGLFRQEDSGRTFINVFDGTPETKVEVDGISELKPLDPYLESSKRLSTHFYELPKDHPDLLNVSVTLDGKQIECELRPIS